MSDTLNYTNFGSDVVAFTTKRTLGRDRKRLCQMLCIDDASLIIPHQTHGREICCIDSAFMTLAAAEKKDMLEGIDAVVTNMTGVCVGVSTADCIPVLLYDARHKAVAAIHAGWKGTVKRIVQYTVHMMTERYATEPSDLKAIIGPGISLKNFEVGDEVYEQFKDEGFDMNTIAQHYAKWHINLWECNRLQLIEMGVLADNIHVEGVCTYDAVDQYFSARREQKGDVKCGRNFNAIMLKT